MSKIYILGLVLACMIYTLLPVGPVNRKRKVDEPPISNVNNDNSANVPSTPSNPAIGNQSFLSSPLSSWSFDQWLALNHEALILHSNAVNLPATPE